MIKFNYKGLQFIVGLFLLAFSENVSSQKKSEKLTGIIRIKKGDSYPYEINYKVDSLGNLNGYSIFNPQKKDETKSLLKGSFRNGKLEFKEYKILSTKSTEPNDKMCFIHFSGQQKKVLNTQMVVGEFKGFFNNQKQCAEGSINFLDREKFLNKLDSTIKTNTKLKDSFETPVAKKILKSIPTQKTDNSVTDIKWHSDTFQFKILDPDKVDNDRISIVINGKVIVDNFKLSEKDFYFKSVITKKITIVIKALNEGFFPPNTSKLTIWDGVDSYFFLNNLQENTSSTYNLIKQ